MIESLEAAYGPRPTAGAEASVRVRYARSAVTPLAWMAVTGGLIIASVWAYDWSRWEPSAPDPVRTSEWWTNITSVLLPADDGRLASYSQFRMWVTLAILVVTAVSIALWIGRIGRNIRPSHSPFGSILPVLALPAWWVLPVTLGTTELTNRSRGDLLVRYLIAFGILFAQFLLLRWPLLNRIWRAGNLRYDLASIILWLPMMIPWAMLMLSTCFSLLVTNDRENPADAAWHPTQAMADWARDLTHATQFGILILLVVVSVAQHVGIRRDRDEEQDRRAAAAEVAQFGM